jgi:hypothetical protein
VQVWKEDQRKQEKTRQGKWNAKNNKLKKQNKRKFHRIFQTLAKHSNSKTLNQTQLFTAICASGLFPNSAQ